MTRGIRYTLRVWGTFQKLNEHEKICTNVKYIKSQGIQCY